MISVESATIGVASVKSQDRMMAGFSYFVSKSSFFQLRTTTRKKYRLKEKFRHDAVVDIQKNKKPTISQVVALPIAVGKAESSASKRKG